MRHSLQRRARVLGLAVVRAKGGGWSLARRASRGRTFADLATLEEALYQRELAAVDALLGGHRAR
jgi:hypothetical protein